MCEELRRLGRQRGCRWTGHALLAFCFMTVSLESRSEEESAPVHSHVPRVRNTVSGSLPC